MGMWPLWGRTPPPQGPHTRRSMGRLWGRSMGRLWGRGVRLLWGRGMRPLWGRGVGPLLEREYKTTVGEGVWNPCCGRVCDACGEGY